MTSVFDVGREPSGNAEENAHSSSSVAAVDGAAGVAADYLQNQRVKM